MFMELDERVQRQAREGAPSRTLLQQVNRDGPVPGGVIHRLAAETATALAELHARNIVHGRISPGTVDTQGRARLIPAPAVRTAEVPAYTAPEQIERQATSPAADVFAWAATVCFAGTGNPPFGEGNGEDVARRMRRTEPELDGLPAALRATVEPCLAPAEDLRPSAAEVVRQLGAAPTPQPPAAAAEDDEEPRPQSVRMRATKLLTTGRTWVIVAALVATGLLVAFGVTRYGAPPASPPTAATGVADADSGDYGESTQSPGGSSAAGYVAVKGPAGSTIQVPENAERIEATDGTVVWRDQRSGTWVQVDNAQWKTTDPVEHWRQWASGEPLGDGLSGLEPGKLIDQGEINGWPTADFTFRFNRHDTPSLAYARAINTGKGQYMIFVSSSREQWEQAKQQVEPVLASFQP